MCNSIIAAQKTNKNSESPKVVSGRELPKLLEHHLVDINPPQTDSRRFSGIETDHQLMKLMDRRLVTPNQFNDYSDRILFMLSLAERNREIHTLARAVGSEAGGKYKSHLMHGKMNDEGRVTFGDAPIEFATGAPPITHSLEDPRITKIGDRFYFTFTDVPPEGHYTIGLASTTDFERYEYHGDLIPNFGNLDPKDPVFFQEPDGKVNLLTRFKPGIQIIKDIDMQQMLKLCKDPEACKEYWNGFLRGYEEHPEFYDYLSPNMPEMRPFEEQWKPALEKTLYEQIMPLHPNAEHFHLLEAEERGKVWYGSGPAPLKTEKGWLGFPHRGQVIAKYSKEDREKLEAKGVRVEDIRLYCVLATLHDLEDPQKLIAVSPMPISTPNPENDLEMNTAQELFSVPYVKIATGSQRVMTDGKPHILVPIGVNDRYTRMEYLPENHLLDWIMDNGRVKN